MTLDLSDAAILHKASDVVPHALLANTVAVVAARRERHPRRLSSVLQAEGAVEGPLGPGRADRLPHRGPLHERQTVRGPENLHLRQCPGEVLTPTAQRWRDDRCGRACPMRNGLMQQTGTGNIVSRARRKSDGRCGNTSAWVWLEERDALVLP